LFFFFFPVWFFSFRLVGWGFFFFLGGGVWGWEGGTDGFEVGLWALTGLGFGWPCGIFFFFVWDVWMEKRGLVVVSDRLLGAGGLIYICM
jgi:hypothetical protein